MTHEYAHLIDRNAAKIAALEVQFRDDHYEGKILLDAAPPHVRQLFERFEEIVEGQIFGLLDDIEEKIATIPLRIRFDDGRDADVDDLQVFPSTNAVSFKFHQTARH